MSDALGTVVDVWAKRIRPLVKDDILARRFGQVLQEIREANHEVVGGGLNQALGVVKSAHFLEARDKALDEREKAERSPMQRYEAYFRLRADATEVLRDLQGREFEVANISKITDTPCRYVIVFDASDRAMETIKKMLSKPNRWFKERGNAPTPEYMTPEYLRAQEMPVRRLLKGGK
jgi:hypothetical protein